MRQYLVPLLIAAGLALALAVIGGIVIKAFGPAAKAAPALVWQEKK